MRTFDPDQEREPADGVRHTGRVTRRPTIPKLARRALARLDWTMRAMAEMECEFPQPLGWRSRKRHRTLQLSRRGARHPGEPDGGGRDTTLTGMPWGTLGVNGPDNRAVGKPTPTLASSGFLTRPPGIRNW